MFVLCETEKKKTAFQFTILELLIVVAIIAMLAALLLPALSRAKESGKQISCKNKMKQFALCTEMYSNDHNGYLPCGYGDYGVINRNDAEVKLMPYLESRTTNAGDAKIAESHFHCPSASGCSYAPSNPERWLGYSMNAYIVRYYNTVKVSGHRAISKAAHAEYPTKLLLMVDGGNPNNTGDLNEWVTYSIGGWMASPDYDTVNHLAQRHSNGLNILFVDGHVSWFSRNGTLVVSDTEGDDPIPNGVAFWNGYVFGE